MLPVLLEGEHLDRNMPGFRVSFQLPENTPAQHVRQKYIERYSSGFVSLRKIERIRTARGDKDLEIVLVREVRKHTGEMRIVLHDKQYEIAFTDFLPVVRHLLDWLLGRP